MNLRRCQVSPTLLYGRAVLDAVFAPYTQRYRARCIRLYDDTRVHCCQFCLYPLESIFPPRQFGDRYGTDLCCVGNVYPDSRIVLKDPNAVGNSMAQYLALKYPSIVPHHAWVGFSMGSATTLGTYHCCNFYFQTPNEYMTSQYHWFLLKDVSDPAEFYKATEYHRGGMRSIADPPRPSTVLNARL